MAKMGIAVLAGSMLSSLPQWLVSTITSVTFLIRRFIDPDATFLFVEPSEVANVQHTEAATGFHAPGARYPVRDEQGRISFTALVEEYCAGDAARVRMARIIQDADRPSKDHTLEPEAASVRMITVAFPELTIHGQRDDRDVERAWANEIRRRVDDYRAGRIGAVPWIKLRPEVSKRARRETKRARSRPGHSRGTGARRLV